MKRCKLKFGFPLGALQDEIVDLFKTAGYKVKFDQKLQKVEIGDPEIICLFARPIAIASLVEKGLLDAGVSTEVSLIEAEANKVKQILELEPGKSIWGKTKVILAVPENSKIKSIKDLNGKKIITRIPKITKEFLRKNKISAEVMYSDTLINESKVGVIADAIVEFSRIGNILKDYNLKPLKTLFESSVILIANQKALRDKWKKKKIESLTNLLEKAKTVQEQKLKFYTPWNTDQLDDIDLKILQALYRNGRKSFVEIAKETKLSPVGVKNRVEKLLSEDILKIQGLLNIKKVHSLSATIGVEANNETLSNLIEKFEKSPLVYHLVKTSGRCNLVIGIVAPDLESIENFIAMWLREEPGVKHIEVNIGELPIIPKVWSPPII
ncbi:MAG: ATP phosphoribosyltransferase [Patescibacteria group bacterium]|nr:ATP phosphoribosyltransferase [Patescibacteria group bacterium]